MENKKNYIAPTIYIVDVETESMMLTASGEIDNVGTGSGTAGNGPELADKRRGSWGDLWD